MIPPVFHRIWFGPPIPERFAAFWERLRELHPSWEFCTWTEGADLTWIRNTETLELMRNYSGRSDVLRIEILARYGGIYIDADMEPLRPFDDLLAHRAFAAHEDASIHIAWGVFGAEPEHPAVLLLRDRLPAWAAERTDEPQNVQSGPVFLTEQWRGRTDVEILPPESFYPVMWKDRGDVSGPYPPESYAVHHWAHSWA